MCNHNVLMQRLCNGIHLPRCRYSEFGWKEYLSDDEGEDLEEDGMKKVVATLPKYYVSVVFDFVLRWPLISKDHPLLCPCNPVFH